MNNFDKRFADIFDEQDDTAAVTRAAHLETIYTSSAAPERLSWAQLKPQLLQQKQQQAWWKQLFIQQPEPLLASRQSRRLRPSRISVVAALILGLLLCTTVVYAYGGSALGTLLQQLQGRHESPQIHMYTDLNQSQTAAGFTLTLNKAYADANRVILGYTIASSHGDDTSLNRFIAGFAQLKTRQGIVLPGMVGIGSMGTGILGLVLNFNALPVQGTPNKLQLQLKMPYSDHPPTQKYHIQGWLTYDFAVPFHAERRAAVIQQSQTSQGQTIILDHIVVSASEARLCMQGSPTGNMTLAGPFTLSAGTVSNNNSVNFYPDSSCGNNMWSMNFDDTRFFSQKGTWTLAVQLGPPLQLPDAPGSLTLTFHFTLPEA